MKKSVIFSIFILGLLIFLALFASFIAPYDPQYVDVSNKLLSPSPQHLLGTDQLGRDVFSRLLYGARYSLFLAVAISVLEVVTGFIVGLVVGWYQGKMEGAFLWLTNVLMAFPSFLLSLATVGILGQGMSNMIIAIVIIEWIYYARIVTNLVISTKQEPYVISSQIMGMGSIHILKKHILPFIYKPVLVILLMNIGNIILMISGFSFLGIGVQPNVSEWGLMLHDARAYFRVAPWMMIAPGLAIFLTVISPIW